MPSRAEIVSFDDSPPPPGANPWVVAGAGPGVGIEVTDPDPGWPRKYDGLAGRIRQALGGRVLQLEHVGSTSVPGLAAKPVIDIDLTVADPACEPDYVPALETAGFGLVIREPWWYGHRLLEADEPPCNLHVFGFDSPELVRHRIFRDWLRGNSGERDRYAAAKRRAASEANAAGEHVMQYNAQAAGHPGDLSPGVRGRRPARTIRPRPDLPPQSRALARAGRYRPGRDLDRAARWQARAHRRPQPWPRGWQAAPLLPAPRALGGGRRQVCLTEVSCGSGWPGPPRPPSAAGGSAQQRARSAPRFRS